MKKTKERLLAYAAGIIDGEGSISLKHQSPRPANRSINESWVSKLTVKMNDLEALNLLSSLFGGNIKMVHDKTKIEKGLFPGYSWDLTSKKATKALKKILPFLRIKKEQAEIVLRYQSRIDHAKHGQKLSDHEIEIRQKIANRLKFLHHKNDLIQP